ncbi:MAG: hypothetical protein LBN40_04935 [Oscillospiraceae bacterium]|jgi:nitrogen regulatory protein PII|nr:hypothetical protein [Oscillospiraceae bacterium]
MQIVFTIIDQGATSRLAALFDSENITFRNTIKGEGSAESATLELLGLGENRKAICLAACPNAQVQPLYRRLNREMRFFRPGAGVAFAVPTARASTTVAALTGLSPDELKQEKGELDMSNYPFELIITIVNRGFSDIVKISARELGARGGTVIHGLGMDTLGAAFLGIQLQPEKDVVLIVVPTGEARPMMEKIVKDAGVDTPGKGICFSLPVSSACGLATKDDPDFN